MLTITVNLETKHSDNESNLDIITDTVKVR